MLGLLLQPDGTHEVLQGKDEVGQALEHELQVGRLRVCVCACVRVCVCVCAWLGLSCWPVMQWMRVCVHARRPARAFAPQTPAPRCAPHAGSLPQKHTQHPILSYRLPHCGITIYHGFHLHSMVGGRERAVELAQERGTLRQQGG